MLYPSESFEHKIGFDAVRQRLIELCVSPDATKYVENITFLNFHKDILELLNQTSEMLSVIESASDFRVENLPNIEVALARLKVAGSLLSTQEIIGIKKVLEATSQTSDFFKKQNNESSDNCSYPTLSEVASELVPIPDILRNIDRIIDVYGNIRDNASPELASIRKEMQGIGGRINSIMRRVISRAISEGYLDADINPTMRDGRLVLPVQPMHKRNIPGIVHDESASGKTYFIEPAEVVEANNRVRELQIEERKEISRILVALADVIRPYGNTIGINADVLSRLDFIHAKALFARELDCQMPSVNSRPEMEWFHAVHPSLQMTLKKQGKQMVALDIELTHRQRILIISGPNAGGKSVCLKTVGIVQYMLQCGLLPPLYSNSRMGIFDDIFIDIGDDQSIEDDLSTYSSHLRNMKHFVGRGRKSSLILIDEFGGGTEPQIGGAIAQAILKEFNNKKMWGVITTHYQNLKHFAEDTDGLVNGSMLYDRHLMQPMFKLSIGNPGSSFAIEIARKTGLPKEIIDDAAQIVGSDYINLDKYLLDITRDKRYWENKRLEIKKKEKQLEDIIQKYTLEAENLSEKRKEIIADAKKQALEILDKSNASIERTIHDIRRSQAQKEATLEARRKLNEEKKELSGNETVEHPLLKKAPKKKKLKREESVRNVDSENKVFAVGDVVKLDGEGTPGKIIELNGKNAVVAFGMIKTTVDIKRLRHSAAKIPSASKTSSVISSATSDASRQRQLNFKPEIDLRGMRADEALQATTYFLDDAVQFGAGRVRILHGTGTGALRQSIRSYLSTLPYVVSYHDEDVRFGGAGITVIQLK